MYQDRRSRERGRISGKRNRVLHGSGENIPHQCPGAGVASPHDTPGVGTDPFSSRRPGRDAHRRRVPARSKPVRVLREDVFRRTQRLTGSRFMRGMVTTGGLSQDMRTEKLYELGTVHRPVPKKRYQIGLKIVLSTASVLDRFATTGIIRPGLLRALNITGPAARASGGKVDVRVNCPYGVYADFPPNQAFSRMAMFSPGSRLRPRRLWTRSNNQASACINARR